MPVPSREEGVMNTATVGSGLSWGEGVALAVLVLLVIAVGWTMYQKARGHTKSDVSGLHLGHHDHGPRES
jgi:hypothetical protein